LLCATLSGYGADYSAPSPGKVYRIWNARYGNVMYETSAHQLNTKSYAAAATSQPDYSDQFLLESKPGTADGYMLRNVATGRYVQTVSANETPYTTGYTPMTVQVTLNEQHNADSAQLKPCYNIFLSGSSTYCLHEAQDKQRVVRWQPTTSASQNYGSEWRFEDVEKTDGMTASLKNTEKLLAGVYRIINDKRHNGSDWYAYQNGSDGLFIQGDKATSGYGQLFLLRYTADDKYSIQSLSSGGYVQTVESNEVAYNTGFMPHGFNIVPWTRDNSHTYYNIFNVSASNGWGWHANQNNKIVRWTPSAESTASASEWKLERVDSISDVSLKNQLAKALGGVGAASRTLLPCDEPGVWARDGVQLCDGTRQHGRRRQQPVSAGVAIGGSWQWLLHTPECRNRPISHQRLQAERLLPYLQRPANSGIQVVGQHRRPVHHGL
ncbi:MAG: hypothetical protein ACI4BG_08000, partial [Prevotella sp.]